MAGCPGPWQILSGHLKQLMSATGRDGQGLAVFPLRLRSSAFPGFRPGLLYRTHASIWDVWSTAVCSVTPDTLSGSLQAWVSPEADLFPMKGCFRFFRLPLSKPSPAGHLTHAVRCGCRPLPGVCSTRFLPGSSVSPPLAGAPSLRMLSAGVFAFPAAFQDRGKGSLPRCQLYFFRACTACVSSFCGSITPPTFTDARGPAAGDFRPACFRAVWEMPQIPGKGQGRC